MTIICFRVEINLGKSLTNSSFWDKNISGQKTPKQTKIAYMRDVHYTAWHFLSWRNVLPSNEISRHSTYMRPHILCFYLRRCSCFGRSNPVLSYVKTTTLWTALNKKFANALGSNGQLSEPEDLKLTWTLSRLAGECSCWIMFHFQCTVNTVF